MSKQAVSKIAKLKLTKGDVLIVKSEDVSQEQISRLAKMLREQKGFRVPVIGLDKHGKFEVENVDRLIKNLQNFKKNFL